MLNKKKRIKEKYKEYICVHIIVIIADFQQV